MNHKNNNLLRYGILFVLFGISIWQLLSGNNEYASALLGVVIFIFIASTIKQKKLRKVEEQGMNPVDERTWSVARMAAYAAYVTFAMLVGGIVLLGSIWGPQALVNPYDLLGLCLGGIVFLYVIFYYYYNSKY